MIITRFKQAGQMQKMLLGMEITLIGGVLRLDNLTDLAGFAYLIILVGLVISIAGFMPDSQ